VPDRRRGPRRPGAELREVSRRDPSEGTMTPTGPPAALTDAERAGSWVLRAVGGKFGSLLVALIALLLSTPLVVEGRGWNLLPGLFASAVLVASLQAARPGRRSLRLGLALALADLGIGRLVLVEGARWLVVVQAVLWLATLLYVTFTILDAIFR